MLFFDDLEQITEGKVVSRTANLPIKTLLLDSRKISIEFPTENGLFFAISGDQHDGHTYIHEVSHSGIRQFIIEKASAVSYLQEAECNVILVDNTVHALQKIVSHHRYRYSLPVIGITGSNGKTVVKEWLSSLLSGNNHVVKNPGSYNSQVGVPLSVWRINSSHDIAVFEAGISQPGEMQKLEPIIRPSFGIFTNIGTAHDSGFSDRNQKVEEKFRLFQNCPVIIYRSDYPVLEDIIRNKVKKDQLLIDWSDKKKASVEVKLNEGKLHVYFNKKKFLFNTSLTDPASFENLVHCIIVLLHMGYEKPEIQEGMGLLSAVKMRMELKKGVKGCYLIDDTYNNDLDGLEMALDFMNRQRQKPEAILIVSDILQSGLPEKTLYQELAMMARKHGVSRVIGIGPDISLNKAFYPDGSVFYRDTRTFLKEINRFNFHDQLILVKGARAFKMESIVKALTDKIHHTTLEINISNMVHNLNCYRKRLKPGTKVMAMVKAFGYGSGNYEIAHLLQFHKVDYLGVAYADEGIALRSNGISIPVMVMNPAPDSYDKMAAYDLEPEVFSLGMLSELDEFTRQNDIKIKIHLKLDTGMHRLGFELDELEQILKILDANKNIEVAGIFSHLAAADESKHSAFTQLQISRFKTASDLIINRLNIQPVRHLLNSSGILNYPEEQFEMVRLGIGLYGYDPSGKISHELKPVSRLISVISQIRKVRAGETVGYGRKGKTTENTTIATIAIGYADGFSRRLGNGRGSVWINGHFRPTAGDVCMDMTMVDVTGIEAKEGDEVEIFGLNQSVEAFAAASETIPYEIFTSVSERVKRVYMYES